MSTIQHVATEMNNIGIGKFESNETTLVGFDGTKTVLGEDYIICGDVMKIYRDGRIYYKDASTGLFKEHIYTDGNLYVRNASQPRVFIGIYSDYDCSHKILFAVRTELEALAEVYNRFPENMPESMPEFKDGHAEFDLGCYGAGVDVYEVKVG